MTRGQRIEVEIERLFKSKAAAARAFKMTPQQLNGYLNDANQPGSDVLERMAAAGVTAEVRARLAGHTVRVMLAHYDAESTAAELTALIR